MSLPLYFGDFLVFGLMLMLVYSLFSYFLLKILTSSLVNVSWLYSPIDIANETAGNCVYLWLTWGLIRTHYKSTNYYLSIPCYCANINKWSFVTFKCHTDGGTGMFKKMSNLRLWSCGVLIIKHTYYFL